MDISLGVLFENSIVCHVFYAIWFWGAVHGLFGCVWFLGAVCFWFAWLLLWGLGWALVWFSGLCTGFALVGSCFGVGWGFVGFVWRV